VLRGLHLDIFLVGRIISLRSRTDGIARQQGPLSGQRMDLVQGGRCLSRARPARPTEFYWPVFCPAGGSCSLSISCFTIGFDAALLNTSLAKKNFPSEGTITT